MNSFGFGGANGHYILDHPMNLLPKSPDQQGFPVLTRRLVLVPFSAHNQTALSDNMEALHKTPTGLSLADVVFTLSDRRSRFFNRNFAIINAHSPVDKLEAISKLATASMANRSLSRAKAHNGKKCDAIFLTTTFSRNRFATRIRSFRHYPLPPLGKLRHYWIAHRISLSKVVGSHRGSTLLFKSL